MVIDFKDLNIGVESISRRRDIDELHLPKGGPQAPVYQPNNQPLLHKYLHRPTLDEKLPDLLQPTTIDPDLTEPAFLVEARIDTRTLLADFASYETGLKKATLDRALALIDHNELLDEEVRASLATLYRA